MKRPKNQIHPTEASGLARILELAGIGAESLPLRDRCRAYLTLVGYSAELGSPTALRLSAQLAAAAECPTDILLLKTAPAVLEEARAWLREHIAGARQVAAQRQTNN